MVNCIKRTAKVMSVFRKLANRTSWMGAGRLDGVGQMRVLSSNFSGHDPPSNDDERAYHLPTRKNPISRALGILKNDFVNIGKGRFFIHDHEYFPTFCDVAIIGGGILGSSIAFWLKHMTAKGLDVVVIEKDLNYTRSSTALSVGGLQQQFSVTENVQMAMFAAEFMRNIKKYLTVFDMDPPNIRFTPCDHLFMAKEEEVDALKETFKLQNELGGKVELLTASQIKERYPWMNVDGIELGCCGYGNEGWFDPNLLFQAYLQKAVSLGTHFINAEVVGFRYEELREIKVVDEGQRNYDRLKQVVVKTEGDDELKTINAAYMVIAAGSNSSNIGKLARIGTWPGILQYAIPIESRKRYNYTFYCPEGPGINCPYVVDYNGAYFRREGLGGNYVCGKAPCANEEPDTTHLDVDYSFFDNQLYPMLCQRVPSFQSMKLKSAWAGLFDYNTFDQLGILGTHPYYPNLFLATGFHNHGVQHSPAIGRAVAELMISGSFETIDLSRLSFNRFLLQQPIREKHNI